MNHSNEQTDDDAMTLDPPGSIAVVGAGALGVEAALYGRFLGYDVVLIEAVSVGHSMMDKLDEPLSLLPDRCLSPLALGALRAQSDSEFDQTLPMTYRQWIDDALVPVTESDLLRGRLRVRIRVAEIIQIAVEPEDQDEDTSDIPPDYRLALVDSADQTDWIDAEAVILAVGSSCDVRLGFEVPAPYFYRIGEFGRTLVQDRNQPFFANTEQDLANGLREIVDLFAQLAGRADLDLYRPRRV